MLAHGSALPRPSRYRSNWNKHLSRLRTSQQGTNAEISLSCHNFSPGNSTVETHSMVHPHPQPGSTTAQNLSPVSSSPFWCSHQQVMTKSFPLPIAVLISRAKTRCGLTQGHAHTGKNWSDLVPADRQTGGNITVFVWAAKGHQLTVRSFTQCLMGCCNTLWDGVKVVTTSTVQMVSPRSCTGHKIGPR